MKELVLATSNVHKIRELRDILRTLPNLEILHLHQFPDYVPPEETGSTFAENAQLKAVHAAKALGKWVIADDSGLSIPALGGEPGIYSARYAGPDATDADNRKKLLKAMEGLTDIQRTASMTCCVALASPDGEVKIEKGECEGVISTKEQGANGHGYDSIFVRHGYRLSFAEIDETTKNRISHRRKAIDKLVNALELL